MATTQIRLEHKTGNLAAIIDIPETVFSETVVWICPNPIVAIKTEKRDEKGRVIYVITPCVASDTSQQVSLDRIDQEMIEKRKQELSPIIMRINLEHDAQITYYQEIIQRQEVAIAQLIDALSTTTITLQSAQIK